MSIKNITILGSTGSIGTQTLDVIAKSNAKSNAKSTIASKTAFAINALTVNKNIELLAEQVKVFKPKSVVITDEGAYKKFKKESNFKGHILFGREGLVEVASDGLNDMLVSALVGFAGVEPTLAAIEKGTIIGLANKETLVAAGETITRAVKKYNSQLLPIDSEHSAIFQCLQGENIDSVKELILTASGGPFFNKPDIDFKNVTVKDALNHPNWSMGSKVTIDSATMMNKGFEVIEAYRLFGLGEDKIKVVIHPQSIVHSLIRFNDTALKAQLGTPDMRMPISYALNYPNRLEYDFGDLDLTNMALEFHQPDLKRFPCLERAFDAMHEGGSIPTVLNAANEVAVEAFLKEKIRFDEIIRVIDETMNVFKTQHDCSIAEIIEIDKEAKAKAEEFVQNRKINI